VGEIAAGTTPLILSDSTIIVSTYIGGKIIALNNNGIEKWTFDTGTYVTTRGMNVGLDGTIYFMDSTATLFALGKDGVLKWTLKIENVFFGNSSNSRMVFSPNGKTLYITGADKAIYAVDVNQKTIIWSFGGKNAIASPLVDSDGNIYLYGVSDYSESNRPHLAKINDSGLFIWEYPIQYKQWEYFLEPTMDYNGNIYFGFGTDSLYSVNFSGTLRWKVNITTTYNGVISSSLVCDRQNNIYVPIQKTGQPYFTFLAFKEDGNLLWESNLLFGESGDSPALGIGSLNCPTYRSTNFYLIK
jgi:outer membrane protein assembly factor BamB